MPGAFFGGSSGPQRVAPPSGYGWDFNAHPVSVVKDGPRHFASSIDLRKKVNSDIWNGIPYYISPLGNNNNNGLTPATPVRSLWKARQLLAASSAVAGMLFAMADPVSGLAVWDRNNDLNDTNGAGGAQGAKPTKPFALMGIGGKHILGPIFTGLVWTFDATTRTYSCPRAGIAFIYDFSLLASLGFGVRLTKVAADTTGADAAARTANTRAIIAQQPGSYATTSDGVTVLRLDRDTVPSDKTLAVGAQFVDAFNPGAVDCYASGLTMLGGSLTATFAAYDVSTRNVVIEDSEVSCGGVDGGTSRNCFIADRMDGFVGLRRVTCRDGSNDHFNLHRTGATGRLWCYMEDCVGVNAGRDGANPTTQSNQNVTLHEDVVVMSLNTRGSLASGGAVRNINTSQHWDLGSEYANDRGDTRFGGTQVSSGVVTNDASKYWGDCTTVRGMLQSFVATQTSRVLLRDPIEIGGYRPAGAGTIGTY